MSDTSDLADTVTDELSEQIDVGGLVTGDDVSDQIDGESLGRSVGEVAGAMLGKRLARRIARWVVSKVPLADPGEGEERSLGGRLAGSTVVALQRTFQKPEFREPMMDALQLAATNWRERLDEAESTAEDAAETGEEAAESTAETAEETAESATETTQNAAEEAADGAEGAAETVTDAADGATDAAKAVSDADELDPEELQSLREETYRDLLEMMEYSQLQSIAKKVGVKANTGREQMLDNIVEQFRSDTDEGEGESGDGADEGEGEDGDSADADSDESD